MFGAEERVIEQFEVIETFTCPGVYKPTLTQYFNGYTGNRKAKAGLRIFVRFHKNAPNKIEVEIPNDVGNREKIFQLTLDDWNGIKCFLLRIERRRSPPKASHE